MADDILSGKDDNYYAQIEANEAAAIKLAAESAYQRGALAQDNFNYSKAYEHYKRATELVPDDVKYLENAGAMAVVGELDNEAVDCFLRIHNVDPNHFGDDINQYLTDLSIVGASPDSVEQLAGQITQGIEESEEAVSRDNQFYGSEYKP